MTAKTTGPATGKKQASPASKGGSSEHTHASLIKDVLGRHHTWWWRMFAVANIWNAFIPWPLPYLAYPWKKQAFAERARWTKSSGWLTLAIIIWLYFVFGAPPNLVRDEKIAAEAAKILFSGAFLLGTILSVSVALPGQAVIKTVITKNPRSSIDFVVPFAWAFMWGIAGATLLMFYPGLGNVWPVLQKAAIFVALYGAMMELNAIGHTVRMYTIGLLLWGMDEAKKKEREIAEKESQNQALAQAVVQALAQAVEPQPKVRVSDVAARRSAGMEAEAEAEAEAAEREDSDIRRRER